MPEKLRRSEQNQNQGQERQYVNIRPWEGIDGLFIGEVLNEPGIKDGEQTSRLLVRGADGKFRPPTNEELDKLLSSSKIRERIRRLMRWMKF
jgi:hypothetical protein